MPTYHSDLDAQTEKMVSDLLTAMGWKTIMMDTSCRWDIEATKRGQLLIVEVKRRNMSWGAYPTIFIDKSKVDAMSKRAERTDGVPVLVIVPNDMQPRFVRLVYPYLDEWGTNTIDVRPERRDFSDKGDLKYEIPTELFVPLETLS